MQGVTRHADMGSCGTLGGFTTLHRGAYAAASRTYGVALWVDARNAASCPAVNAYRQSLINGSPITAPAPLTDCPAMFGNLDIYSGSFSDPTP
jgi:hypothetical protein